MDLSDLNNFTVTKQLKDDANKFGEIVSRERNKIIKTMVNQEASYYDLQSKYEILETNTKKLKENMVIIQTEYEALSGKFEDEVRYRPETLNQVNTTRELTDCLENFVIELNDTLSRCQSDYRALSLAIEKCTREGKAIKEELKKQEQQSNLSIAILEDKLQYKTENENKMLEGFNSCKNVIEGELKEHKMMLMKSQNTVVDINKQNVELKILLTHNKQEYEKISMAFKNIEKELEDSKNLIDNLNTDIQMKTNMLIDLSKSNEELKSNIKEKDASTNSILEQKNELTKALTQVQSEYITLTEKFNNLEGEHMTLTGKFVDLNGENYALTEKINNLDGDNMTVTKQYNDLEGHHFTLTEKFNNLKFERDDAIAAVENLKLTIVQLNEDKEKLNKTLYDKEEIISKKNGEILNLKKECETAAQLVVEMKALQQKVEMKNKLLAENRELIDGISEELANKKREYENERLANKQSYDAVMKEVEEKRASIESLQAELKRVADESAGRLTTLQELNCQFDRERADSSHAYSMLVAQNEKLKLDAREVEERNKKQMELIKELQKQRDKLQEKEDHREKKIKGVEKAVAALKTPKDTKGTSFLPAEPLQAQWHEDVNEWAGIQNVEAVAELNINKRTKVPSSLCYLQTKEPLFSSQSSSPLFACDEKYKYFFDETDEHDDDRKPPPPKHRRRLGPKSSVKHLQKELKTKAKRSKKPAL